MRLVLLLVSFALAVAALFSLPSYPAAAAERTTLSGGGLARPITLSPLDEQAFFQRINTPPKLDDAPSVSGKSYTVTSSYWDTILRGDDKDAKKAAADATYYPDGGFIKAKQGDDDAWLVIDLRQRAVLDRYIRLAESGAFKSSSPSTLDVLRAAVASGEDVGVQVGNQTLSTDQRSVFWRLAAGITNFAAMAPSASDQGLWVTFNLAEGRAVELLFWPPGLSLADASGSLETYAAPPALEQFFSSLGATTAQPVAQDAGRGSPLWWPLGLGIGAALLAAAMWLQGRISRDSEGIKDAG